MKKILFFATEYWGLLWMYNVIKDLDAEVFNSSSKIAEWCQQMQVKLTNRKDDYDVVVLMILHYGGEYNIAQEFLKRNKQVVVLQHAWDPGLHLKDKFWDKNMGSFSHYIVGCHQDYEWLCGKYPGKDRIHLLGMPRLDDLYEVKKNHNDLSHIYKEVELDSFYLASAPMMVINQALFNRYASILVQSTNKPFVFKVHPGFNAEGVRKSLPQSVQYLKVIADNPYDRFHTYELIKASEGIICVESFMAIEASFLGKPVVQWGKEDLPPDWYQRDENINQIYRTPQEMMSDLKNPVFKEKQQEIADLYLCDGKNTERVVAFLKSI